MLFRFSPISLIVLAVSCTCPEGPDGAAGEFGLITEVDPLVVELADRLRAQDRSPVRWPAKWLGHQPYAATMRPPNVVLMSRVANAADRCVFTRHLLSAADIPSRYVVWEEDCVVEAPIDGAVTTVYTARRLAPELPADAVRTLERPDGWSRIVRFSVETDERVEAGSAELTDLVRDGVAVRFDGAELVLALGDATVSRTSVDGASRAVLKIDDGERRHSRVLFDAAAPLANQSPDAEDEYAIWFGSALADIRYFKTEMDSSSSLRLRAIELAAETDQAAWQALMTRGDEGVQLFSKPRIIIAARERRGADDRAPVVPSFDLLSNERSYYGTSHGGELRATSGLLDSMMEGYVLERATGVSTLTAPAVFDALADGRTNDAVGRLALYRMTAGRLLAEPGRPITIHDPASGAAVAMHASGDRVYADDVEVSAPYESIDAALVRAGAAVDFEPRLRFEPDVERALSTPVGTRIEATTGSDGEQQLLAMVRHPTSADWTIRDDVGARALSGTGHTPSSGAIAIPGFGRAGPALEKGSDRFGGDLDGVFLPDGDPTDCQRLCTENADCRAFTFVRAGVQSPDARCWLKRAERTLTEDDCCTSGLPTDSPFWLSSDAAAAIRSSRWATVRLEGSEVVLRTFVDESLDLVVDGQAITLVAVTAKSADGATSISIALDGSSRLVLAATHAMGRYQLRALDTPRPAVAQVRVMGPSGPVAQAEVTGPLGVATTWPDGTAWVAATDIPAGSITGTMVVAARATSTVAAALASAVESLPPGVELVVYAVGDRIEFQINLHIAATHDTTTIDPDRLTYATGGAALDDLMNDTDAVRGRVLRMIGIEVPDCPRSPELPTVSLDQLADHFRDWPTGADAQRDPISVSARADGFSDGTVEARGGAEVTLRLEQLNPTNPLMRVTDPADLASGHGLSADAVALMQERLMEDPDRIIVSPKEMVSVGAMPSVIGWFELDPGTGRTVGVTQDGLHGASAIVYYAAWLQGLWAGAARVVTNFAGCAPFSSCGATYEEVTESICGRVQSDAVAAWGFWIEQIIQLFDMADAYNTWFSRAAETVEILCRGGGLAGLGRQAAEELAGEGVGTFLDGPGDRADLELPELPSDPPVEDTTIIDNAVDEAARRIDQWGADQLPLFEDED